MKRVVIIGGGIAGLAAGILLRKHGFETVIFEKEHEIGGLCTSWKRGDYTFNGCLHWILGTRVGISFYHFWKELFDIDSIQFIYHKERVVIEDKEGRKFHFINDIDNFEHYLLNLAPEDKKEIHKWCKAVRFILPHLEYLPPVWREGEPWYKGLRWKSKMISLLPMLFFMLYWGKLNNRDFAKRFKNEYLRHCIENLYSNEMRMTVMLFAQAYATKKVAGYPLGGSLAFAKMIEKEYLRQGGILHKNTLVDSILHNKKGNNKYYVTGVRLSDKTCVESDIVISAIDWLSMTFGNETIRGLEGRFATSKEKAIRLPKEEQVFYSFCMLHIGIRQDLNDIPHYYRFPIEPLISPDGTHYDEIEMNVYNYDNTLTPKGKTSLSVNLHTHKGLYWIKNRKNNMAQYKADKAFLTSELIKRLRAKLGDEIVNNIEVTDLCTPATYHRYTGNYAGSSQGWTPMKNILQPFVVKGYHKELENFYYVGHWTKAGGGVPVAIHSAREIVRKIVQLNRRDQK